MRKPPSAQRVDASWGESSEELIQDLSDENEVECIIVTGDKDDLQLASDNTKIYLTTTSKGNTNTDIYDAKYGTRELSANEVIIASGSIASDTPPPFGNPGTTLKITSITTAKLKKIAEKDKLNTSFFFIILLQLKKSWGKPRM